MNARAHCYDRVTLRSEIVTAVTIECFVYKFFEAANFAAQTMAETQYQAS